MKHLITTLVLLSLAMVGMPSLAASAPKIVVHRDVQVLRFYGYARDLDSGKYLYTEVHARHIQAGRPLSASIAYFAPNGTRIAKKVLDFSGDPYLPLFRFDQRNVHYSEGISKVTADKVYVFRQINSKTGPGQVAVDRVDGMAAVSGIDNLIRAHFEMLVAKRRLEFSLLMARNLHAYDFAITRLKDSSIDGTRVVRFKVELRSLMRLLIGKPMIFAYDPATRKLLEYRGVSDLYNPKNNKPYMVRVDYGPKPPANAPNDLPALGGTPEKH